MDVRPATKRYKSPIIDNSRWDVYEPRDGDVVIATPQKGGTTWMQAIVAHLLLPDGFEGNLSSTSYWLDARVIPLETVVTGLQQQAHRRFIKTHLPSDGLPLYPQVRYLVVGRDGRDIAMSLWNHYSGFSDDALANMQARSESEPHNGVDIPKAPDDVNAFWWDWMTRGAFDGQHDGWPFWSDLYVMQSWFDLKDEPNVKLIHYADMLANTREAVETVARFLDVPITSQRVDRIVEQVSFTAMKNQGEAYVPFAGNPWKSGASTFFNKGTNGRWAEEINAENLKAYDATARRVFSPDCAAWVASGKRALT